jgi:magnesium-transporting ATPase (P-type)
MDEEQRKWQKQYSSHMGAREFLILIGAIMGWVLIGALISVMTNSFAVFLIFFVSMLVFAVVSTRWKPAYSILYKLLGNKNLPTEPFPRAFSLHSRQQRVWWSYLPGLWWLILVVILLLLVIRYFAK